MKFSHKVYRLCKKIPKGRISTYKEISGKLNTKAHRAVGNTLNKNPYSPKVPCHRIVNSDGKIGGFASGIKNKIRMLRKEGVEVKNNRIVDFEKLLYKFK